jgi:CRP-like cAMP-binding protein
VRHRRTSPQPPSTDDAFFASVEKLSPLSPASRAAWEKLLSPRSFGAGEWLLRAGEQAHWSFFVVRGLVREFYVSDSGEEHTRVFVPEGQLTGSLLDLISGQPAVTWIQALEPTDTLAFRYREFEALCDRFPDLQRCARRFAERLYARKAKREYEMLALSAQQRHAQWLTEHAALDGRIRRQLLASYLGITPEHLSRLRRGPR